MRSFLPTQTHPRFTRRFLLPSRVYRFMGHPPRPTPALCHTPPRQLKLPQKLANTNATLSRLGSILEDFDEKYFSKYLSAGTTPSFQDTLAAASSSKTLERKGGVKGTVASASKGERERERRRTQGGATRRFFFFCELRPRHRFSPVCFLCFSSLSIPSSVTVNIRQGMSCVRGPEKQVGGVCRPANSNSALCRKLYI